jgi:hypothetical protein
VIFHLHIGTEMRLARRRAEPPGIQIGHPLLQRRAIRGTHVHLARKYNGEWILARYAGLQPGWLGITMYPYLGVAAFSQTYRMRCSNGGFLAYGESPTSLVTPQVTPQATP